MRKLFILLLTLLPFTVGAIPHKLSEPRVMTIPYYPTGTEHLTKENRKICIIRAQVGAVSFTNAKKGISLEESRANLARIVLSQEFERFIPVEEHPMLMRILEFAYEVHKKFPNATKEQVGDRIFDHCVWEKSAILVRY